MFNSLNNYIKVNRKKNSKDLAIGLLFFYVIPYLFFQFFSKFSVLNALSTEMGYGIFIFAIFLAIALIFITVIATLNIVFDNNLYFDKDNSLLKKIFLTVWYAFPLSVFAHFFYFLISSVKNIEDKSKLLLITYLFSFVFLIATGFGWDYVEIYLMKSQFNSKDYSIKAFSKVTTGAVKDELVGKKYKLKLPLMLLSGFPKEKRINSNYLMKADYLIEDLKRTCVNCFGHDRVEGIIKAFLEPSGGIVEVVGAFKSDNYDYLLIKFPDSKVAEISKTGFELNVVKKEPFISKEEVIYDYINMFQLQNFIDLSICIYEDKDLLQQLKLFIKDFKLDNEMEIIKYYKKEKECSWINFKTMNSLLLFNFYREDWWLYGDLSDPFMSENYGPQLVRFNYQEFLK